jgi:hypothetical protein
MYSRLWKAFDGNKQQGVTASGGREVHYVYYEIISILGNTMRHSPL